MVTITDEFAHLGIIRGKTPIFRVNEALFIVSKCRERNFQILGIDAFIITPTSRQPVMEDSPDWSYIPTKETWELAETFFKKHHNSDLYFEIIIDD